MTVHPLVKLGVRLGLTGAATLFGVALLSATDGPAYADDHPLLDRVTAVADPAAGLGTTSLRTRPTVSTPRPDRTAASATRPSRNALQARPAPKPVAPSPAERALAAAAPAQAAADPPARTTVALIRAVSPALGAVAAETTAPLLPALGAPPLAKLLPLPTVADPLLVQRPNARPASGPSATITPPRSAMVGHPSLSLQPAMPDRRPVAVGHARGGLNQSQPTTTDPGGPANTPATPPGSGGQHSGSAGTAASVPPGRFDLARIDGDPTVSDDPAPLTGRTPQPSPGPA